jgi:hypothetical protein
MKIGSMDTRTMHAESRIRSIGVSICRRRLTGPRSELTIGGSSSRRGVEVDSSEGDQSPNTMDVGSDVVEEERVRFQSVSELKAGKAVAVGVRALSHKHRHDDASSPSVMQAHR